METGEMEQKTWNRRDGTGEMKRGDGTGEMEKERWNRRDLTWRWNRGDWIRRDGTG